MTSRTCNKEVTAMEKRFNVIEVTKENEHKYLQGIVGLENMVLAKMEQEGKIGQLFITGEEGISDYINSDSNHVIIAEKNDEDKTKIISTAYITQGQIDFTYNDITKYFKCGPEYQEFVKAKYTKEQYEATLRELYIKKICAFTYARNIVLQDLKVKNLESMDDEHRNILLMNLIEQERKDPLNQFHEKSEIRDKLNMYMSLYIKKGNDLDRYQEFYWVDFDFLKRELTSTQSKEESNKYNAVDSTLAAYDSFLKYQKYKIYDKSNCKDISKYFTANTGNTIELDTYITAPDSREYGIARILVLEGLKKSVQRVLKNESNKEVFFVSTLHEENLSSKYVSEFFGLKDYIFVNRRNGRDRQVHICGVKREDVPEYINKMEKKIAVLYGYNPNKIKISDEERTEIIQEQIKYETDEISRLNSIKDIGKKKKFSGFIKGKKTKIDSLHKLLEEIQNSREVL